MRQRRCPDKWRNSVDERQLALSKTTTSARVWHTATLTEQAPFAFGAGFFRGARSISGFASAFASACLVGACLLSFVLLCMCIQWRDEHAQKKGEGDQGRKVGAVCASVLMS